MMFRPVIDKELELERERKLKKEQKDQATSDGPKESEKKQKKKDADDENPEDFIDPETPSGEKKSLAPQMAKQYSPSAVEKS
ncbi:hypothetical protein ZWY2020_014427 [Hordeum vulgare]|nr:hypothetical protein ZWY2020_014427 [Hordeum vulgare]